MIINPTEKFVIVELERIKWFLGQIDLTKNEDAGNEIQDAYNGVSNAIRSIRNGEMK